MNFPTGSWPVADASHRSYRTRAHSSATGEQAPRLDDHGSRAHPRAGKVAIVHVALQLGLTDDLQPDIPTSSSAITLLAGLTVKPSSPGTGYSRDLFPTWDTVSGKCNTRYVGLPLEPASPADRLPSLASMS